MREYPYLNNSTIPAAVAKMLDHTPIGFRNKALGFLIKFLKEQCRLNKAQILEILTLWAKEACEPSYPEEAFTSDFNRLYYQHRGLIYDAALAKEFGYIDFKELPKAPKVNT